MNFQDTTESAAGDYTVRRFHPEDAPGVSACVRQVYGDTYIIHRELYEPAQIIQLNEMGQLISVVALDAAGQVVGHYGLERPDLGRIAESGEAMVLSEHRHHHLLERMRALLLEQARLAGLAGVYGLPVTNHTFSQKMYDHSDGHPCAVSLGITPRSFHNLPEPLTQRLSCLLYFEYLAKPPLVQVYAPELHHEILARIYAQFGLASRFLEPKPPTGPGSISVEYNADTACGFIRVRQTGGAAAAEVAAARRQLTAASKAEVVFLELPLADAGTPNLCRVAEAEGFFFAGVGPCFADGGDMLRLQVLNVELDTGLLKVDRPFARELLAYAEQERRRVSRRS